MRRDPRAALREALKAGVDPDDLLAPASASLRPRWDAGDPVIEKSAVRGGEMQRELAPNRLASTAVLGA